MTLYDALITCPKDLPGLDRSELRGATIIQSDNVTRYWAENLKTPTAIDDVLNLCLAPPFSSFFIQTARCGMPKNYPDNAGIHCLAFERDEIGIEYFLEMPRSYSVDDVKWVLFVSSYIGYSFGSVPLGMLLTFELDEMGYVLHKDGYRISVLPKTYYAQVSKTDQTFWLMCFYPLLAAITFMNCKNVELIDNIPSRGMSRKHERRTGEPLVSYKTIKVNPMRTVKHATDLDTTPAPQTSAELAMPLSIWRGHFKDYRDGKGLFGKFKEVYWWDQHMRGDIENGVNVKDYTVEAPTNAHVANKFGESG